MAKYNVKHSCGCTVEHNLFGKSDYRDYKIEKLEGEKCYTCRQNEKIEEKLNSGRYEIIEVHYSVYAEDRDYGRNKMLAVPDSYNKATKTIKVVVKKSVTEEEYIQEIDQRLEKRLAKGLVKLSVEEFREILGPFEIEIEDYDLDEKKVGQLARELLNGKYNRKVIKDNEDIVIILSV